MRLIEAVVVARAFMPVAACQAISFQRGFQTAHGVQALRLVGRRKLHHFGAGIPQESHQIDLQLRLHQVLAGLAWEHDHDRKPLVL